MSTQRKRSNKSIGAKINAVESKADRANVAPKAVAENSITDVSIAPNSITNDAIAPGSVSDESIANGAVGTQNLGIVNQLNSDSTLVVSARSGIALEGDYYRTKVSSPDGTFANYSIGRYPLGIDSEGLVFGDASTQGIKTGTVSRYYTSGPVAVKFDDYQGNPPEVADAYANVVDSVRGQISPGVQVVLARDTSNSRDLRVPWPVNPSRATNEYWTIIAVGGVFDPQIIPFWYTLSFNEYTGLLQPYESGTYSRPGFSKTNENIVITRGMFGVVSSIAAGTTMWTMPPGFRPEYRKDFNCLWSTGNGTINHGTISVFADGRVTTNVSITSTGTGLGWITTDNIIYPEAATGAGQWVDIPTSSIINGFTAARTSEYGNPGYFIDRLGGVWLRGCVSQPSNPAADTIAVSLPTAITPNIQQHHPMASSNNLFYSFGATPAGVQFKVGTGTAGVTHALNALTWISPASVADSRWIALGTANGWTNTDQSKLGFYYRQDRLVYMRGFMRNGSIGAAPFVSPSNLPIRTMRNIRVINSNSTFGRLDYAGNAQVPYGPSTSTWISLDSNVYLGES